MGYARCLEAKAEAVGFREELELEGLDDETAHGRGRREGLQGRRRAVDSMSGEAQFSESRGLKAQGRRLLTRGEKLHQPLEAILLWHYLGGSRAPLFFLPLFLVRVLV